MVKMRTLQIFSTGQVARICLVAPRTVSKNWFDSGRLRGYRIPGSRDRRIPLEHLIAFLREYKMQDILDRLVTIGSECTGVYIGAGGEACAAALGADFKLHIASNQIELGFMIGRYAPGSVLIDFARPGKDNPAALCAGLRALPGMEAVAFIGIRDADMSDAAASFDPSLVDASVSDVLNFLLSEIVSQVAKKAL